MEACPLKKWIDRGGSNNDKGHPATTSNSNAEDLTFSPKFDNVFDMYM